MGWVRLRAIAWTAVQLGLFWLIARGFRLESPTFLRMLQVAFAGILLRACLPDRLHWPLFTLLSLGGIVWLLGPTAGLWLLALGGAFLGLAHLPVRFGLRIGLILAAALGLAILRPRAGAAPWPDLIWPIWGSMFMFRSIVYLYDLRHKAAAFGPWQAASYFFMLPNVCFPLFPVVDYKTFVRSWRGKWEASDPQQGLDALFRGFTQLLLYRLVYQHLTVDVTAIETASGAALYLVRPYLLYLKISGSFHVIVGILQCFGFALPRSNHNYYLAASFTDYWRRINIYWKDFLQKILFNPAYFALNKRVSPTTALVLATLIAFVATWALHSYQWFWIRGSFPIVWQDIVFWSFMGLVVLWNMLQESRRGRTRSLKAAPRSLRSDLRLAGATVGTFLLICCAWAIWSVQSTGELRVMLERLAQPRPIDLVRIVGSLVLLGALAVFYARMEGRGGNLLHGLFFGRKLAPWRVTACAGALVFLGYAPLVLDLPPRLVNFTDELRNPQRLSGADAQAMDRGYYEDLTDVARFNPELAERFAERPPDWERCWAIQRTGGFPTHTLQPLRQIVFKGAPMSTNSHGMRDREYTLEKPQGVHRIALHGASHEMGTGVRDEENFEALLEARLDATGQRFEILNFAVGGYGPLSRLYDLEAKILDFEPDDLILSGINDLHWAAKELLGAMSGAFELPWPELYELARQWEIEPGMDAIVAEARLRPHRAELLGWVYERTRQICQPRDIGLYFVALPQPRVEAEATLRDLKEQLAVAAAHGFVPIDILDVYGPGPDHSALRLAKWDGHPNAQGHAMLADRLYLELAPHFIPGP